MSRHIFEDKQGYVAVAPGQATRATLRIQGSHSPNGFLASQNVFFLTGLQLEKGVNTNLLTTLDNHLFLSAAGDRLGSMRLTGMVFGSSCDVDYGQDHGGLHWLLTVYKDHRLLSDRGQDIPYIEVFHTGTTEKCTGLVAGVKASTSTLSVTAMDFSLDCFLIP